MIVESLKCLCAKVLFTDSEILSGEVEEKCRDMNLELDNIQEVFFEICDEYDEVYIYPYVDSINNCGYLNDPRDYYKGRYLPHVRAIISKRSQV